MVGGLLGRRRAGRALRVEAVLAVVSRGGGGCGSLVEGVVGAVHQRVLAEHGSHLGRAVFCLLSCAVELMGYEIEVGL